MTQPPLTTRADDYVYQAIARMRRTGLRHMPVVDGEGRLVGLLNLHDSLGAATRTLMDQIDSLTRDDDIAGLAEVKKAQIDLADQLFRDNARATEIQALLSHINLDLYHRVVERNLRAMATNPLWRKTISQWKEQIPALHRRSARPSEDSPPLSIAGRIQQTRS